MTRKNIRLLFVILGFALSLTANPAQAQQPQPSDSATSQAAPLPAATRPASIATGKKGKEPYSGPTTLVELPPTPMLDEEGNQRQDPDGKLLFNPPIKQQRDKYGHPLFDELGKPVMQTKDNLGYDENGKKLHPVKEKPPKTVSASISRGILTVDGMTGKAALNYEIKDLKYLYFYVPGIGTTIISNVPFPGAVEQKKAFDDKTLTITMGEHTLQLSSDKSILDKRAESAFVLVDKNFLVPTKFPIMGYGPIRVAPYAWPGSKKNEALKGIAEAPPLPSNLQPDQLLPPCPVGQMRTAGTRTLPGQTATTLPCVPIATAGTVTTSTNQSTPSKGNALAAQ